MRTLIACLTSLLVILLFFNMGCESNEVLAPEEATSKVTFTVTGLQELDPVYHYHGWLLWLERSAGENFEFLDLGAFPLNGEGEISGELELPFGYVHGSKVMLFTAEVDSDTVYTAPEIGSFAEYAEMMDRLVIGGLVNANVGDFSISYAVDPYTTFEKGGASFVLDTPSDSTAEYYHGLWFVSLDTVNSNVSAIGGLRLPMITDLSWYYEAFVDIDGEMISLGTFNTALEPDDAATFYDPNSTHGDIYQYPGEDFITREDGSEFLPDLRGRTVYLVLDEGFPESIGDPFTSELFPGKLVLFQMEIPQDAQPGITYSMEKMNAEWPKGSLSIDVDIY